MSARLTTWLVVAVATIGGIVAAPAGVNALDVASPITPAVQSETRGAARVVATAEPADDAGGDGPGAAPVIGGLVILGAVLAIGLSAIRRQRAEGRRSKLPPIG